MDALETRRRDNVPVSNPLLLVKTSDGGPEVESPIFRLPIELTILIFRQYGLRIRDRITLTHVCRRWRRIAVNDPSLWTNIFIQTNVRKPNARLDHFLSFIGMQLDRTADLPLDVAWYAALGDEFFIATLNMIRDKAPFARWRTLMVHMSGGWHQDAPWSPIDTFANLESLLVWHGTENTILSVIDRTITSRLRVLDLRTWPPRLETNVMTSFAKSLTCVSSLLLQSLSSAQDGLFLPDNVIDLHLEMARDHPFPHLQSYELGECTFTPLNTIDLRNVTTLIVGSALTICSGCHVHLPALRELKLRTLLMDLDAKIEAPSLEVLYFINSHDQRVNIDVQQLSDTSKSLLEAGYLLSPKLSITADSYLPSTTLINLLAKSPKVTHANLRFDSWPGAQTVLERLVGFKTNSRTTEPVGLCPKLSELKLDFGWELSDPSASKEWLLNRLKVTKDAEVTDPLAIHAGWKGQGTYLLLIRD